MNPALADQERLPKMMKMAGPDGPVTIHRADVYRRMPVLEAFLDSSGIPVAAVWAFVHGVTENGQQVRAAVTELDGQAHVFVNTLRARCPLVRLALVAHEAEHILNGDLQRQTGFDADQESQCEAAAGNMVQLMAKRLKAKGAAVALDVAACWRCYDQNDLPCPQGSDVFSEVTRLLSGY